MKGKQTQIESIYDFYHTHKRMPSYAEVSELFGLASKNSAYVMVKKFIDQGKLQKDNKGKLLPVSSSYNAEESGIRLLGAIEAGFGSNVEEQDLDRLTLDDWIIKKREASFMLKVTGDSMKDAGILPGDYVVVERTNVAKNGEIVIAEVDGKWTMKYLRKKGNSFYLQPANPYYPDIYPDEILEVAAIVKAVIRKY